MRKTLSKINVIYIFIDILLISTSAYLPYILRYNKLNFSEVLNLPTIWVSLSLPQLQSHSLIFLFWTILIILILNIYGLFRTDRELSIPKETYLVFKAIFFASLPTVAAIFFLKVSAFSRLVFAFSAILMFVSLSIWRSIKRCTVRRLILQGYNNVNVLIVGAGRIGKALAEEIDKHPYLGFKVVGYLDDFKGKEDSINGYDILGKLSDFEKIVRKKFVDEVFITIPSQRQKISELTTEAKSLGVAVRIIPDMFDIVTGGIEIHHIGIMPLLEYHSRGIHGTDLVLKRSFDVCLSAAGLLLLSPLFLILSVLIKIDNPGPVLYVSKRCGKKGRLFHFYKFRSMVKNADRMLRSLKVKNEKKGPIFKMADDPRITKVGRFMRRLSLDELPQLWNVFRGDMSLVGPRPPTPEETKEYKDWQLKRMEVKPGITCLWQVRGRSNLSFYKWVKLDIWYINNWSFWLDLKILWLTIPVVFKGKGAY